MSELNVQPTFAALGMKTGILAIMGGGLTIALVFGLNMIGFMQWGVAILGPLVTGLFCWFLVKRAGQEAIGQVEAYQQKCDERLLSAKREMQTLSTRAQAFVSAPVALAHADSDGRIVVTNSIWESEAARQAIGEVIASDGSDLLSEKDLDGGVVYAALPDEPHNKTARLGLAVADSSVLYHWSASGASLDGRDSGIDSILSELDLAQLRKGRAMLAEGIGGAEGKVVLAVPLKDAEGRVEGYATLDYSLRRSGVEEAMQQSDAMRASAEILARSLAIAAGGDINHRLNDSLVPELEEARLHMNKLLESCASTMEDLGHVATNVTSGAQELAQASDDLSRRTENQAATLEETATALDQITSSVKASADGASDADRAVKGAQADAKEGGEVVLRAVEAMEEIEGSASQISQIINVIDDIAFQTNLLALNAGVEAARAGEAGRGFAVVASEVRALAQRTSDAAREIKGLITSSSERVASGVDLVGRTGEALTRIVESVGKISGLVEEIAQSSQEQSTGLEEINVAVNQLDQVTQENAAMVEESTAATHAMRSEADRLTEILTSFVQAKPKDAPTSRTAPPMGRLRQQAAQATNLTSAQALELTQGGWEDF